MRCLLAASFVFYTLLFAAVLGYGIMAYRCDCRPPIPSGLPARLAIYYGLAIVLGIYLAWRD